jgi:hypothetical protein
MAYAEDRGRLEAEELGWSERAEAAIATASAYFVDGSDARPDTPLIRNRGARYAEILFAAACVVVELVWIASLAYFVFAYLGVFQGLFSAR